MAKYDYVVVGGGIVGLSVAWTILEEHPAARIAVLEKEQDWARHQTGRNSGVIHSGIYYKAGSLKSQLCIQGSLRLRRFSDRYGIPYEMCGKVIVATRQEELPLLARLFERGQSAGLSVRQLAAAEVAEFEPTVQCLAGLHVPATGIINYTDVCRKLAELICQRGGELHLGVLVKRIRLFASEVVIETPDREWLTARMINCAGLHSDRVARRSGTDPTARIVPFRGEYYQLRPERRHLVRNLIYPVPDPEFPFLGVHFTRMMDGSVHAGPNAVLSLKREGYHRTAFNIRDCLETITYPGFWRLAARHARAGLDEIHRSFSKPAFVRSLQRLIPDIVEDDLIPSEPGVRAQALRPDGGLVDDFLIVQGLRATHVVNAPSPAATASLEIGRYVAGQLS